MALNSRSVILVITVSICCTISDVWSSPNKDYGTMEELAQRMRRIEDIQRVQAKELVTQKHTIQAQAREIANLKTMCELRNTKDEEKAATGEVAEVHKEPRFVDEIKFSERQISNESGISFTVYLDYDVELGDHQTIKFNKIITNEGNGFNTFTGVFTCPRSGMYMFAFYIGERGDHDLVAALIVNSINVVNVVVDTTSPSNDLQGSNMVIKRMRAGDVVWVELYGGNHVEGSTSLRLTTFSGVYLYA